MKIRKIKIGELNFNTKNQRLSFTVVSWGVPQSVGWWRALAFINSLIGKMRPTHWGTTLKSKNIEVADIYLSYDGHIWHFSDKQFESEFVGYHDKAAFLRIISSEEKSKTCFESSNKVNLK
jgi:hypothetical protein